MFSEFCAYALGKTEHNLCSFAPLVIPCAGSLGGISNSYSCLVALQIWDMHTTKQWREYQVLSVPIRGLAWGTQPNVVTEKTSQPPSHDLCIFAYGWQSSENGTQDVMTTVGSVKNFVVKLNLTTGYQQQICTNRADNHELRLLKLALQKGANSGIKAGSWWNVASELTEYAMSNITPIRLIRVSNLG